MRNITALIWILCLIAMSIPTYAIDNETSVDLVGLLKGPPAVTDVTIDGPGALYIATDANKMTFFWVLDNGTANLVKKVPFQSSANMKVNVTVRTGITSIFYADNLPLGNNYMMGINGEGKYGDECPTCRVVMPLPAATFGPFFTESKAGLSALEATQEMIFKLAQSAENDTSVLVQDYVDQNTVAQKDFHTINKNASGTGNDILTKLNSQISAYEPKIRAEANQDSIATEQIANKYAAFALTFPALKTKASACSNYERIWARRSSFITSLNLVVDADEVEAPPDGADNPRNKLIDQFESGMDTDRKAMEVCQSQLFSGFLLSQTDIAVPGTPADLSKGNFVSAVDYETILNQLESIASKADTDLGVWQAAVEGETSKIDRLKAYLEYESNTQTVFNSVIKYASPMVTSDGSGKTASMSIASTGSLKIGTGIVPLDNSLLSASSSSHQCKSNPVFSITLNIPLIIGSPFNDQITGGSKKNAIFSFSGDDCVYGKGDIDLLFSGSGDDLVDGGSEVDFMFGGRNNDLMYGGTGKSYATKDPAPYVSVDVGNLIVGGAGDDTIYGMDNEATPADFFGYTDVILGDGLATGTSAGPDKLHGDHGIDFIFGQEKDDMLSNSGYGRIDIEHIPVILGSAFFGGAGNDTINGTDTPTMNLTLGDFIFGNGENDLVNAGKGQDFVFGGGNNDALNGNEDNDFIFGGDGSDTIHVNDGILNLAIGGKDADTIYGDNGQFNALFGGAGPDTVQGGTNIDLAMGNDDVDKVLGGSGLIDVLLGGAAADDMSGEAGIDAIFGNAEKDRMKGGDGIDLISGGDGADWADGENDIDIIFGNGNTPNEGPRDTCIKPNEKAREKLYGSKGIDLIFGGPGCDDIYGGDGIDALFGGGANDMIYGEASIDIMFGGDGPDELFGGPATDVGFGNEDNDMLSGDDGSDILLGGNGADKLIGDVGGATNCTASSPCEDLLLGNGGNDNLYGGKATDLEFGGAGTDGLFGEDGSDILFGGDDPDSASGGPDSDLIFGGNGDDNMLAGDDGSDAMFGSDGVDTMQGGAGNDIIFGGEDADKIDGLADDDLVFGNGGNDYIWAVDGSNISFGGKDDDKICSQGGNEPRDFLFGNSGSDTLAGDSWSEVGAAKKDWLFLGAGGTGPKMWDNGCPAM